MFRRLFISLLILSTLTTDNPISLKELPFGSIFSGIGFIFHGEKSEPKAKACESRVERTLENRVCNEWNVVDSLENIIQNSATQSKARLTGDYYIQFDKGLICYVNIAKSSESYNKSFVFNSSDISPPVI